MKKDTKKGHVFEQAINKYISLLNAQKESFPIIISTLTANLVAKTDKLKDYIDKNNLKQEADKENVTISIPFQLSRNFFRYNKDVDQSLKAINLISNNVIVAFVSIYDAFLGDLLKGVFQIKPEILNSCNKEFSFSEIIKFQNIDSFKEHIIEKEIETILRDSHSKQIEWIANKLGIKLTSDLPDFKHFIEITERRNLFVHADGKVSKQYIAVCKKYNIETNLKIGDTITVDANYFKHCYDILFEIGIKLGQVLWRNLDSKNSLEEADENLIDINYDLLKNKEYKLASKMLDFSTKKYVKHYNKEYEYIFHINLALSYYLQGKKEECYKIIDNIDWSAIDSKYKLAVAVLKENYEEACNYMECVNKEKLQYMYGEWPLFTQFRCSPEFKQSYKKMYGTDFEFQEIKKIGWEETIQSAIAISEKMKLKINQQTIDACESKDEAKEINENDVEYTDQK